MDAQLTCFECGAPAAENHHVVPRILGGQKTIPLCGSCHGLAHMARESWEHRSFLTKLGIQKAREAGKILGRPKVTTDVQEQLARALHENGNSISSIARNLKVSRATVLRIVQHVRREDQEETSQQ